MKKKNKNLVLYTVIATGISSVTSQLVIVREFLALFSGNEFFIAMVLFNWLIAGGLGSLAFLVLDQSPADPIKARIILGRLSLVLCALSLGQIFLIRLLRNLFFIYGSSPGFYATFFFSFFSLLPYAGLVGFILPFSLRVMRSQDPEAKGALIYITDNVGDILGGLLFSFVLVQVFHPVQAIALAGLPLFLAGILLVQKPFLPVSALMILATCGILGASLHFEITSLEPPMGNLAQYLESRYGRITVIEDKGQHTLFQDGEPVYSSYDPARAEESTHYALCQVPSPKSILLISAQSGIFSEIAKYKPQTVDYVEIDPELTTSLLSFGLMENIPGLSLIHQDARAYLSRTSRTYDAIILNLPEPTTFQVNRFYTRECFNLIRDHLNPYGVLSFSIEGYDSYLDTDRQTILDCLYSTADLAFDHLLLIPGQRIYFLCSQSPLDPNIPSRLSLKNIPTHYIGNYFKGDVSPQRIKELAAKIQPVSPANTDTQPRLMAFMFTQWFSKFKTRPVFFIVSLFLFLGLYLPHLSRTEFLIFTTGFSTMGSELLMIFCFQIVFGYIYYQIGVLVTVFLSGLLPGAFFAMKINHPNKKIRYLKLSDAGLIVLIVLFAICIWMPMIKSHMAFYVLFGLSLSFLCGFQFPLALANRKDSNSAAGRAFSADLVGAAFGILVTSVILVPLCGLIYATCLLGLLKVISSLLFLFPLHSE
ncbi:MAG: hypothetical protein KKD44_16895 [Proteobacteria bacterium]|nr:hypothetical protein [Pseudomonadota bacterium]